jgi:hypothetical protein
MSLHPDEASCLSRHLPFLCTPLSSRVIRFLQYVITRNNCSEMWFQVKGIHDGKLRRGGFAGKSGGRGG